VIEGITAMEGYKNKSSLYIKLINNSNVPFYYNIKTTIVNKNGKNNCFSDLKIFTVFNCLFNL
jgi:hypothetical protein